jgi:hypothetical protein
MAVATALSVLGGTASAARHAATSSTSGAPDHIFYIMMENHGFSQIIGNTADAPNINELASQYNLATNFHGVTHPSLPNYLAAISGDFQGIWDDCKAGADVTCAPEEFVPDSGDATASASLTPGESKSATKTPHLFSATNLVDQLEQNQLSWKAYMENLPAVGSQVEYAPVINGTTVKLYAQKHNPFMYFSDINYPGSPRLNNIVPFEDPNAGFFADLNNGTVPNFSFISPNQCHDMHGISASTAALIGDPGCANDDTAIQEGDTWLANTVTEIMNSTTWQNSKSEILIAWDENDYSGYSGGPNSPVGAHGVVLGGGDAPLIVIPSQPGSPVTNNTLLDHYNTLYAIQKMWHLGCLANTCGLGNGNAFMNLFTIG